MEKKKDSFKVGCVDYIKAEDGKTNRYIHYSYKEVPMDLKSEFEKKFAGKKISSKMVDEFIDNHL